MKPLIVLLITGTLAAATVTAQVPADSAKVYFRLGHRQYDPSFENNSSGMNPFVKEVKRHNAASNIERITVRSYTSPDGSNAANERLSRNRCSSISELILNETGIDPLLMHTEAEGIAWDELLRMVEADTSVPYRDEVTELLRHSVVRLTELWSIGVNPNEPLVGNLYGLYHTPTVGASGAVFGILLAFGYMFPNVRLYLIFPPVPIRARVFVLIYAGIELLLGIYNSQADTVAHFAHLGGMLFGLLILIYWRKKRVIGGPYF